MALRFLPSTAAGTRELEACLRAGQAAQRRKHPLGRMIGSLLCALAIGIAVLFALPQPLRAGGPRAIAGTTFFDPAVQGTPLTWSQGAISYYTDRGNLSPALPGASADAFVADAFSRWTLITTAAVSAVRAGQLAEDVSGPNVSVAGGIITLPADILPAAKNFPVAIVYDADGAVTNALLGQGAGSASSCFSNAAYGGVDSFSTDAHLQHALVILNGICAQTSTQLPDLEYRLVRVLGRVLGLDWSQMNLNVFTRSPVPTSADFAGLTIMHAMDPINCVPISVCYANADQPKMDDRAALSRLYPVTAQNQAAFPGKQLFFENTVRIHGAVLFADANGQPAQAMQGVNVVARWIDPATSQPSRTFAAASVSGFLFRGNAGNSATGFSDSTGQALARFGSDDPAREGFFDLAGLEIPNGASSAQYQLSVEALDPLWSQPLGPYGPWQVRPSGSFQPLIVTVSKGGDLQQDVLMQSSALQVRDFFEPTSFAAPVSLPASGDWAGTLSGLGNADYFWFIAQSDRTLTVEVTAVDEAKAPSLIKAQPVIGMWALADPGTIPAPANTGTAFNSTSLGMTRLDATLQASTAFRVGIFDYRGDGRPDYRYRGRVFYADNAVPSRARVDGRTAIAVQGLGFRSDTTASIAAVNTPVLAASANRVIAAAPAMADGLQSIALRDPATGASSTMTNILNLRRRTQRHHQADPGIESSNSGWRPGAQSGSGAGSGAGWDDAGGRGQRLLHLHTRFVLVGLQRRRQLHAAYRRQRTGVHTSHRTAGRRNQYQRPAGARVLQHAEIGAGDDSRDYLIHGSFAALGVCLDCAGSDGRHSSCRPAAGEWLARSREYGELSSGEGIGDSQFLQPQQRRQWARQQHTAPGGHIGRCAG